MGTHPIFESDFDCLTEMDAAAEISVKLRMAVKKKLTALKVEFDDDLCDYILLIFAQKKRFKEINASLIEFLEGKTDEFSEWLDELIRKVNSLGVDPDAEEYRERIRQAEKRRIEIESSEDEATEVQNSDSDSGSDDSDDYPHTRSRSRSPPNRINIFLDDSRKLHEIESDKKELQRKARRLNKDFSKNALKNPKKMKLEYRSINERLLKLLETCDAVELDKKDEQNRKHRKKIVKDIQQLLDRNDKAVSFL